jgi:hypothetical protein
MIASFIVQYYAMPAIMTDNIGNVTNSLGKIYLSVIMALMMGLLEVFMPMGHSPHHSIYIMVMVLAVLLIVFVYIYRNQKGINDANYLSEMIEHHSMAILTSKKIVKKTRNPAIKKLARQIIAKQKEEIDKMRKIHS